MRFVPAVAASVALVLAGPVIGQVRSAFFTRFPNNYKGILLGVVLGAVALAVATAIVRIRTQRAARFGLIAAALLLGFGYSWVSRTGNAGVDGVERFHFIEYGLITLLFYRAWRPIGDASLFLLPVLAGVLVGTCEEWFQWFVPARVGEVRDVLLNLWAIVCGLLFSIALDPPEERVFHLRRESWRRVRRFAAVVTLVFALFFHFVHLGYEIADGDTVFRSSYSAEQLRGLAVERAARWRASPPLTWSRYSREDQYLSEGVALAQARNRCWDAGNVRCAWSKNMILERYYAPVLDTPSFVSAAGLRWPAAQRQDAQNRLSHPSTGVITVEDESIIYTWSKRVFWGVVIAAIAVLLAI